MSAASVAAVVTSGERSRRKGKAWCCLQVKLCDPYLSALSVQPWPKSAIYSSFPFQSINQSINIRLLRHDKTHANNVKRRNANNIQIIIYKKQQCQIDEGNV